MRVAHFGNLGNCSFEYVTALRNQGIDAHLIITCNKVVRGELVPDITDDPRQMIGIRELPPWCHLFDVRTPIKALLRAWRVLRPFDILQSYTMGPILTQFVPGPIHIPFASGSDLREFAMSPGLRASLLRRAYRRAPCLMYDNVDSDTLKNAKRIGVKCLINVPDIIDLSVFHASQDPVAQQLRVNEPVDLLLFSTASQIWKIKGNDSAINAIALFKKNHPGISIKLKVIDYGPDVQKTKELAERLGLRSCIEWMPFMKQTELASHYRACDVVIGHFVSADSGAPHFPLLVQHAMACGKPVISHLDVKAFEEAAIPTPPILGCENEVDIERNLLLLAKDSKLRARLGAEGQRWCQSNSAEAVAQTLATEYTRLLGFSKNRKTA